MKNTSTLAVLLLGVGLAAAQYPVSVQPTPGPRTMNQPLSAAISTSMPTTPTVPSPLMTSQPTWGGAVCDSCGSTTCSTARCRTRPWCLGDGTGLERLKQWLFYAPCDGGYGGVRPTPYQAPLRAYFPYKPGDCGAGGCAAPAAGCSPPRDRGMGPVRQLLDGVKPALTSCGTTGCDPCRPKVLYVPLSARADCVPTYGCDGWCGKRPNLGERLMNFLTLKWMTGGDCGACSGAAAPAGTCGPCLPNAATYTYRYACPIGTAPAANVTSAPAANTTSVPPARPMPLPTSATRPFTNQ